MNCATEEDSLFIVCDGMGGHEKGEVASKLVAEAIANFISQHYTSSCYFSDNDLRDTINYALDQLDAVGSDNELKKMGTTLALVLFHKGGCTMAHIGDSRIYHIRKAEKRILYKSRDHSLVYDLFQAGELNFEEMSSYPKKNVITRAMMPNMDERPLMDIAHTADIQKGDCFYLCSDGMLERMIDDELLKILCSEKSGEEKVLQLVALTEKNADNHSAYLIDVREIKKETGDTELTTDEAMVKYNAMLIEKKFSERTNSISSYNDLYENLHFTKYLLGVVIGILIFLLMFLIC